jgi:SAM-dependent methyltransferase
MQPDEDPNFWRAFPYEDLVVRVAVCHAQRRLLEGKVAAAEVNGARYAVACQFISGRGIEVGAGTRPVPLPEGVKALYGDIRDKDDLAAYFGEAIQGGAHIDAQSFAGVKEASLDFVISAHVIEHLHDPIGSIGQAIRILRPGGRYLLIVPDMRYTFDRDRPETSLDHLLADYEDGGRGTIEQAYRDHLLFVHPFITGETIPIGELETRIRDGIARNLDIHVHAWTATGFRRMLEAICGSIGFRTIFEMFVVNENIFVLEKYNRLP